MSLAKAWISGGLKEQMNSSFAQWFDMSVAWLKHQFGEFTDDGRISAGRPRAVGGCG